MRRWSIPAALVSVCAYTAVLEWVGSRASLPDVPLLYLPLVLAAALAGAAPGVAAAIASTLAIHVLFVAPRASLRVALARDALTVVVYLALTIVITLLIARTRAAAERARHRAEISGVLERLASAGLALAPTDPPDAVASAVAAALGASGCAIWLGGTEGVALWASAGMDAEQPALASTASWVAREAKTATVAGDRGEPVAFVPIAAPGVSGAFAVERTRRTLDVLDEPSLVEGLSGVVALLSARAGSAQAALEAEAARRSDELKSSLLSMVSHELRSPLTAIKATVGSMMAGGPIRAQEDDEALAAIDAETDRLNRLVRNLLDASRIDAGQMRVSPVPVGLRALLGELADRTPVSTQLVVDVPGDLYVRADPVLLAQVVRNLLENADRHGKPPVRITADVEGDVVVVRVADRGPGLPPEALGRVFDRFVRYGRGGMGLGLALCRAIVEAHGGAICADNASDGGLVVTFTLPASQGDAEPVLEDA